MQILHIYCTLTHPMRNLHNLRILRKIQQADFNSGILIFSFYIGEREFWTITKICIFLNPYKMGRKSIPILLKATSAEGETKTFTSIGGAAKELGFSECGVGKAFHEKRNRIGEYELEWLEPEPDVDPEAAVRIERLKKTFTRTVCVCCNKPLTREDRVEDGFGISKLNERLDIR